MVFTNDDLQTEILIRLAILCIDLFTTVSKQWLQILTSPDFTDRRGKIPNLDLPAGIFANHLRSLFECDFVSLDSRLNSKKSTMDHSFGVTEEVNHVRILQSCNGLLLCTGSTWPVFIASGVFRMTFYPRKSLYYKVVQAGRASEGLNRQLKLCKLNIEDHDHPIMTSLEIPHGLHRGGNFLKSALVMIQFYCSWKYIICCILKEKFSNHVGVCFLYTEMILALRKGWSIRTSVWSICFGEGEEDAFVVINLFGKVVKYNLISKTNNEIFDIGSNQTNDDDDDVEFIPPFSVDHNLYEFISSLASV
ncbi:hypothetical protein Tco_0128353 [Tanacetum coccineum]